jgi:hypothetical protein
VFENIWSSPERGFGNEEKDGIGAKEGGRGESFQAGRRL